MRIENNGTRYFGFDEVAVALGVKPISKTTKDKTKLDQQRDKFMKRHKCRACGQPLTFMADTNIMVCTNPKCKGIKVEKVNADGEKTISHLPSYHSLDEIGVEIAGNLFSAEG